MNAFNLHVVNAHYDHLNTDFEFVLISKKLIPSSDTEHFTVQKKGKKASSMFFIFSSSLRQSFLIKKD